MYDLLNVLRTAPVMRFNRTSLPDLTSLPAPWLRALSPSLCGPGWEGLGIVRLCPRARCQPWEQLQRIIGKDRTALCAVQLLARLDLAAACHCEIPAKVRVVRAEKHLAHPDYRAKHVQVGGVP